MIAIARLLMDAADIAEPEHGIWAISVAAKRRYVRGEANRVYLDLWRWGSSGDDGKATL